MALPEGAGEARIIAGQLGDTRGPARTFTPMNVWDMRLKAHHQVTLELPPGHTTALFVLKGAIRLGNRHAVRTAELAVMERRGSKLVIGSRRRPRCCCSMAPPR